MASVFVYNEGERMRTFLFLLVILVIAGGSGWALRFFIFNINPFALDVVSWVAVYSLVVLGAASVFAFINTLGRLVLRRPMHAQAYRAIIRHGLLLGVLFAVFAWLQQSRMLNWVSGVVTAVAVIAIEAFLSRRSAR